MEFYKITKTDIPKAVDCLKRSFENDPLWNKVFKEDPNKEESLTSFFTCPLLYGLKFGQVYASSPEIEGIVVLLPRQHANMTMWGMLRCGALKYGAKMGKTTIRNLSIISKQLSPDRNRLMNGKYYLYLGIIGIHPDFKGKEYGSKFMHAIIEECNRENLYLYLETEVEENIRFYEKHGLKVVQKIEFDKLKLPMWQMVYAPK